MRKTIKSYAYEFVKLSATRNPFVIAEDRNIKIRSFEKKTKLLGMYTAIKNNRFIMYNKYVPEYMQRMIISHEIAHDTLHREMARDTSFEEWELFNVLNQAEYEANIFASHLLLDENEIFELAYKGCTDADIASILDVNVNMLIFKIYEINKLGAELKLRKGPKSDFFKDIDENEITISILQVSMAKWY